MTFLIPVIYREQHRNLLFHHAEKHLLMFIHNHNYERLRSSLRWTYRNKLQRNVHILLHVCKCLKKVCLYVNKNVKKKYLYFVSLIQPLQGDTFTCNEISKWEKFCCARDYNRTTQYIICFLRAGKWILWATPHLILIWMSSVTCLNQGHRHKFTYAIRIFFSVPCLVNCSQAHLLCSDFYNK